MGTTLSTSDPPRPADPTICDSALPDDPVLLQGMIRELLAALQAERHQREHLEQRLDQLLRRLYGPRSEKIVGPTLFDAFAPPAEPPPPPPEPVPESAAKKKQGHGRRRLPADLPRQRLVHDLSEAERLCPCCQSPRVRFAEDLSERLDYVPASLYIVEHVRPKYVCRKCAGQVAQAALPPEPIEKGIPGAGLLAEIIVNKFVDHQPLHRQQQTFQRQGVDIHRSTMGDWLGQCAHLLEPIYALMVAAVLKSKVIHTDDTPVRLLEDQQGETRTGRLWVYWGDDGHPYTVYEATASRSRDGPKKFLGGFKGHLQADAFSGYDCVFDAGVTEVGCWAHARRKFVEALKTAAGPASEALARIRALYDVEERAQDLTAAERLALRQAESAPLLKSFGEWIEQARLQALPKNPLAEALGYVRNQWRALNVYVTDGDLSIDNNVAERALRGTAIGRKNWLFFGSETGGRTAAILTSFTATCRRLDINPWLYLKNVLSRIRTCPAEQLPALLPDAWAKSQAESIAATPSN